jgi:hypothetical protein
MPLAWISQPPAQEFLGIAIAAADDDGTVVCLAP